MKSAGNDIVALKFTDQQRTCQPAFYSKFITVTEQELYRQPDVSKIPFEKFVWLIWAVKEAAYKYLHRHNTGLVFSPSKIIVQNFSDFNGSILHGTQLLYFKATLTDEFIAAIVNYDEDFVNVYWDVQQIDKTGNASQSKAVRELVLTKLKSLLHIDDLRIEKSTGGYPILLNKDKELDVPVSLAHHGNYVAYSFRLDG